MFKSHLKGVAQEKSAINLLQNPYQLVWIFPWKRNTLKSAATFIQSTSKIRMEGVDFRCGFCVENSCMNPYPYGFYSADPLQVTRSGSDK